MEELIIYYSVASLLMVGIAFILFRPYNKKLLQLHRWLNRKLLKPRYEKRLKNIFYFICYIYFIVSIVKFVQVETEIRFFLSLIFIFSLLLLNNLQLAIYQILLAPINFIRINFKKDKPGITKKLESFTKVKYTTIVVYSYILVSFSFSYIVSESTFIFLGALSFLLIVFFLIKSLYEVFIAQKNLFLISDKFDEFARKNLIFEGKNLVFHTIALFFHVDNLFKLLKKEKKTGVDSTIKWLKNHLGRLPYISKLGFSFFKTYLTLKLVFIVFTTMSFFIIINANYFQSIEKTGLLITNHTEFIEYALLSFYIFLGESISTLSYEFYSGYFSFYILFTGILGWLLTVTYIVLFFDIISLSVSDLYETVLDANKNIIEKTLTSIEDLEKMDPDTLEQTLDKYVKSGKQEIKREKSD